MLLLVVVRYFMGFIVVALVYVGLITTSASMVGLRGSPTTLVADYHIHTCGTYCRIPFMEGCTPAQCECINNLCPDYNGNIVRTDDGSQCICY